jgi:hypothetical protein
LALKPAYAIAQISVAVSFIQGFVMSLPQIQTSVVFGLTLGLLTTAGPSAEAQVYSVDDVAPQPDMLTEAAALTTSPESPTAVPSNVIEAPHLAATDVAPAEATDADDTLVAQQTEEETSERINYAFGPGGTIGLSDDGETALGEGGFSLVGRFSLTDNLSVHTASVIGDNSLFTAALTGGAAVRNAADDRTIVFPFAGAGISVETNEFDVNPFIAAGVDVPIIERLTGTARINASFDQNGTDVGVVLGVGYDIFSLF